MSLPIVHHMKEIFLSDEVEFYYPSEAKDRSRFDFFYLIGNNITSVLTY